MNTLNKTLIILMSVATAQVSVAREALPEIDLQPGMVMPDGKVIPDDYTPEPPKRGIIETHNAIESQSLRISLDSSLHGFVEGKVCDQCETIKVTVTPETRAYDNDVEVPLIRAKNRIGRYATVIYELNTKNVSEIRW
jgi:hypothetical protein